MVAWPEPTRSWRVLRQQAACRAHPVEADELSAALLAAGGRAAGPALAVGPQAEQAAAPRQALWAQVSQPLEQAQLVSRQPAVREPEPARQVLVQEREPPAVQSAGQRVPLVSGRPALRPLAVALALQEQQVSAQLALQQERVQPQPEPTVSLQASELPAQEQPALRPVRRSLVMRGGLSRPRRRRWNSSAFSFQLRQTRAAGR